MRICTSGNIADLCVSTDPPCGVAPLVWPAAGPGPASNIPVPGPQARPGTHPIRQAGPQKPLFRSFARVCQAPFSRQKPPSFLIPSCICLFAHCPVYVRARRPRRGPVVVGVPLSIMLTLDGLVAAVELREARGECGRLVGLAVALSLLRVALGARSAPHRAAPRSCSPPGKATARSSPCSAPGHQGVSCGFRPLLV